MCLPLGFYTRGFCWVAWSFAVYRLWRTLGVISNFLLSDRKLHGLRRPLLCCTRYALLDRLLNGNCWDSLDNAPFDEKVMHRILHCLPASLAYWCTCCGGPGSLHCTWCSPLPSSFPCFCGTRNLRWRGSGSDLPSLLDMCSYFFRAN